MQPKEQLTDQELIAMCLQGNDRGYTGLYNRYARRVYNSVNRIIAHTGEAEDILQDTFFNVFSEPEKLKGLVSFEAWVRRMAINKSINHLRKRKIVFADLADMEIEAENEYDADENEIFECKVEDVKRCIEDLPEGYRTIFNLYLFEKMNQEEIAVMLGISHTTVRTQYHRAKKKIMENLKDRSYYE